MLSETQAALLREFAKSWPTGLRIDLNAQAARFGGHPLEGEILALSRDSFSSFPYFLSDKVAWVTLAPDVERLQAGLAVLRAWILPSLASEDRAPFVAPGDAGGSLSDRIISLSPAGYFRWWCRLERFTSVVRKLTDFRRLEAAAPVHVNERAPSLFELRQEFELATITGDRASGTAAIEAIDRLQLDTATNTQFMRLQLLDQFREYERIVSYPRLDELLQVSVPPAAGVAIVRSFHTVFLHDLEARGEFEAAREIYQDFIEERIGGLIAGFSATGLPEGARLLVYRAWNRGDFEGLKYIAEVSGDGIAAAIAAEFAEGPNNAKTQTAGIGAFGESPGSTRRPVELLLEALARGETQIAQALGLELLGASADDLTPLSESTLRTLLSESLAVRPNSRLAESLVVRGFDDRSSATPQVPTTWLQFLDQLLSGQWQVAGEFLATSEHPPILDRPVRSETALVDRIEECLTDPKVWEHPEGNLLLRKALPLLVKEYIIDSEFPRGEWVDLYSRLFGIWGEHMRGSAARPACEILLTLAGGILEHSAASEVAITQTVRQWWQERASHTMLPFLLSALVLLSDFVSVEADCASLWIEGADLIRRDGADVSPGERALWKRIGSRLGLDSADVDGYLKYDETVDSLALDPIREVGYGKIAIVTLRERSARFAADVIRGRTDATVVVVVEEHPSSGAASAATADVILFMWLSNSHATYRAFDKCRDKIAYVSGTTADSIVLALERWSVGLGLNGALHEQDPRRIGT